MSFDDNHKRTGHDPADSNHAPDSHKPLAEAAHGHQTPTPRPTIHHKQQIEPISEPENSFIKEGKIFAHTVNVPFTSIPFLPAATSILKSLDKTTGWDLGFTYKASLSGLENAQSSKDLIYNIDYIGFGVMSSKFNVQAAPLAAKIEAGKEVFKGFGCSLSMLASPIGFVHERLGAKATVTDCNNDSKSISLAPEISYQKSSSFKPISTATYGYFFGNDATLRIPAEYIPTLERIKAASPSLDEWKTITDHISPSIPAIQIGRLFDRGIEIVENLVTSNNNPAHSHSVADHAKNTETHKTLPANSPAAQKTEPGIETKTSYTVQDHDSLALIAKKMNRAWSEIYALNKDKLNNNPDRIYPGQKLDIPQGISHPELLNDPTVQARIAENLKKHPIKGQSDTLHSQKMHQKPTYIVQANDTLEKIGNATGHSWQEIFALNANMLKNNPDKIHPGQALQIPPDHDHATLINQPAVQARIAENMARYQNQYSHER